MRLRPCLALARSAEPSAGRPHDCLEIAIPILEVGSCFQPASSHMRLLLFLGLLLHNREILLLAGHNARRASVPLAWPLVPALRTPVFKR